MFKWPNWVFPIKDATKSVGIPISFEMAAKSLWKPAKRDMVANCNDIDCKTNPNAHSDNANARPSETYRIILIR